MRHFIKLERSVIDIGILIRIRMVMRNRGCSNQSRMQFLIMLVKISFFFIDWLCMITVMIIIMSERFVDESFLKVMVKRAKGHLNRSMYRRESKIGTHFRR